MEPSIAYRPATADDLEPASRVFNRAQNDDPGRCFVAERQGDIVGFGSARPRRRARHGGATVA